MELKEGVSLFIFFIIFFSSFLFFYLKLEKRFIGRILLISCFPLYFLVSGEFWFWIFFVGNWVIDIISLWKEKFIHKNTLSTLFLFEGLVTCLLGSVCVFLFPEYLSFFPLVFVLYHWLHIFLFIIKKKYKNWALSFSALHSIFAVGIFLKPNTLTYIMITPLFYHLLRGVILAFNENNRLRVLMGAYRNKLFRSEKKYLQIFEASPAMHVLLDKEFNIIDCNRKFLNAVGVDLGDVLEKNINDYIPQLFQNKLKLLQNYLLYHKSASGEFALINNKKNDSIDVFLSAIKEERDTIFVIMQDITAVKWMQSSLSSYAEQLKKEMEKAKIADQMKSVFLANMSHEIRTPLTSIIGFATLLKETNLEPVQLDYLTKVVQSSEHLLQIINDIIDLSKIEAGKMDIEMENTNLNKIFQEVYDMSCPQVAKKNVQLKGSLEETLQKHYVYLDGFRLKQVFINLLSNAVKFTEEGHVSLAGFINEKGKLVFEVKDTGIGISGDKQKVIFDPFVQAEDTLDRKYGGTGLGLAISKRLITLMGGEIELESEFGKGTCVRITFDESAIRGELEEVHQRYFKENSKNQDVSSVEEGKNEIKVVKKIDQPVLLVGEDNDSVFVLLKLVMERYHVEVIRGKDGNETLRLYEDNKDTISVVLLDIELPEINGVECAKKIKEESPNLKILGFSAYTYDEVKSRVKGVMDGYIKKPFKLEELYGLLKPYL